MTTRVEIDKACPFCCLTTDRLILEDEFTLVIRDGFPISKGHTLIIPRRHVQSFFHTTHEERASLLSMLDKARDGLDRSHTPDGYNIGINDGAASGQTVPHLHMHLIPRYEGDQEDPRGGVRWIFPDKADYWSDR
jgi:diadenosine tetraphosphate (Ap4A) HIT family hydrolase